MCPMQRGCATVPAAQGLIRGEGFSLPGHGSPCVLAGRAWEYPLSRSEAISRVLLRCEVTQQFAAKQALAAKAADAAARHAAQHMLGMQAALQTALRERDQARAAASNVQAQVSRRAIAPDVDAAGPFDCTALAVLVSEAKLEKLPEQTALRHIDNGEEHRPGPQSPPGQCPPHGGLRRVAFLRRSTAETLCYGTGLHTDVALQGGPVVLRRGEYVVAIAGKSGGDGCLAQWLLLETSEGRALRLGEPEVVAELASLALVADLDFRALDGQEIVGLQVDPQTGALVGVQFSRLPPSRRAER